MTIEKNDIMIYILNHDEIFTSNLDSCIENINFWKSSNNDSIVVMITYLIDNHKYNMLSYNIKISDYIKFLRKRKLLKMML